MLEMFSLGMMMESSESNEVSVATFFPVKWLKAVGLSCQLPYRICLVAVFLADDP
jgi:hypothetical protein